MRSIVQGKQRDRATDFVGGLLSDLERKNAESMAYRHHQERMEMQYFPGQSRWDHRPLLMELAGQVGRDLGRPDGVLVFDPSAFPKKGTELVGVQRQSCGRLGKVENCQVGVFMAYVSEVEQALVNMLYLPRSWAKDRPRRRKCHVPRTVRFRTRHALCLQMLDQMGHLLPHAWITGNDEMGRSTAFRRDLRAGGEQYLLAVPSNTLIRDLDALTPRLTAQGTERQSPFVRVSQWYRSLPPEAWENVDVRDGEKGPVQVEVVSWRVQAKSDGKRVGPEELLVIIRVREETGVWKYDFYLSNARPENSSEELARVAKAEHRIEDCLKRGKTETGLADYEVCNGGGWHHQQTLSLIAGWSINVDKRRGEKKEAGLNVPPSAPRDRQVIASRRGLRPCTARGLRMHAPTGTESTCPPLPLQTPQGVGAPGFHAPADLRQ